MNGVHKSNGSLRDENETKTQEIDGIAVQDAQFYEEDDNMKYEIEQPRVWVSL
jgi:hypothetical protein